MDIKKIPPQVIPYSPIIPSLYIGSVNRVIGGLYGPFGATAYQNTITIVANKLYAVPFIVLKTETFDLIQVHCNTASAGNAHLGIYADNGSCVPGALVLDAGTISVETTGTKAIAINQTLEPGLYWLVGLFNSTPVMVAAFYPCDLLGIAGSVGTNAHTTSYYTEQAYGDLPTTYPALDTGTQPHFLNIMLRRA